MTDVLTLALDPESQKHFEALRQQHFPPERNQIPAHLTMFHTLPREAWVRDRLREIAGAVSTLRLQVTGVRSLGKGVAYTLASQELEHMHQQLSEAFREELTAQDRQRLRPHIVVQNKVTPEAAKLLLHTLEKDFVPRVAWGTGLDLWHYLGGPWQLAERFPFRTASV